jgi:hypothetical protein
MVPTWRQIHATSSLVSSDVEVDDNQHPRLHRSRRCHLDAAIGLGSCENANDIVE